MGQSTWDSLIVYSCENTQPAMLRLIAALGLAAFARGQAPARITTCAAGEYNKDVLEDDKSIRPLENGKLCLTLHRQNMTDKIGWKDCTRSATADQKWSFETHKNQTGGATDMFKIRKDGTDTLSHKFDVCVTVVNPGSASKKGKLIGQRCHMVEQKKQLWKIQHGMLCLARINDGSSKRPTRSLNCIEAGAKAVDQAKTRKAPAWQLGVK